MLRKKTTFIIGAGASAEVNFPIGSKLADMISNLLHFQFDDFRGRFKGDINFVESLKRNLKDTDIVNKHIEAARIISQGIYLCQSIDNFIDIHQENNYISSVAKACIFKCIIEAERKSAIFCESRSRSEYIDLKKIENTWYRKFATMLVEGVNRKNIQTIFNNVSVISFNYDRSLEYFLLKALQPVYSITEDESAELLSSLKIIHPYGTLGPLRTRSTNGVDYGADSSYMDFLENSKFIKTYTEQIEDESKLKSIRETVLTSDKLVFLGFAFHKQNLKILGAPETPSSVRIYATAKGFSDSDVGIIKGELRSLTRLSDGVKIHNRFTCSELFDEYKKTLSA